MLQVGDIVRTSYGSGPYRIIHITRNCRCPDYLDLIDGSDKPSKPHMHLVCVDSDEPIRVRYSERKLYWLNGYREYPEVPEGRHKCDVSTLAPRDRHIKEEA